MANQEQQIKQDQETTRENNHERSYMYGRLLAVLEQFERQGINYPKNFVLKNWNEYHNYPEKTYNFLLMKAIEEAPQFKKRDEKTYYILYNELEHIREIIDNNKEEYDEKIKKSGSQRLGPGSMFGYEFERKILEEKGMKVLL